MSEEEPEMNENMKFQQSLAYLESIKSQLEALGQQQEILKMAELEHTQASETLTKYQDLEEGKELLVPIGADSMVFASVADKSKVIISIGAKYAVEQSIEDSIITLGKRIDRLSENRMKIDKSTEGLRQQAEILTMELQGMYQKLQQPDQE